MIFDTDILIFAQRGSARAIDIMEGVGERFLSAQTFMELLQGAFNKQQHVRTKAFLADFGFVILPLTQNIGHRAMIYVEQYALSYGMTAGDAIVAATAAENGLVLVSGNEKHFRPIVDIQFKLFRPS